jgi:glycosyltransferase involved in cell wall biosynthesis
LTGSPFNVAAMAMPALACDCGPMRIVHAVNWSRLAEDAAVEQSINTAAALARNGADVTVLLPKRPDDPILAPEDFVPLLGETPRFAIEQFAHPEWLERRFNGVSWLWRCHASPAARAADAIILRMPLALVTGAGPGRRFVLDQFRTWPDNFPLLRPVFRRRIATSSCLGLLLHSHHAARSFENLGVDPDKLLVAHNGVNLDRLTTSLSRDAARERLGLPPNRTIVAYGGRLVAWKGIEALLAIAEARPDILVVLAGSRGDGPVERAAAAYTNVQILPWQTSEGLAVLFAAADVLAVPPSRRALAAKRTVLPIKLFAYLAAGKPILAPRLPDTAGLLVDEENALLVEPDDVDDAVRAIDRIVAEPGLAQRLGANARALAETKTWDTRARLILAFLERRLAASYTGTEQ